MTVVRRTPRRRRAAAAPTPRADHPAGERLRRALDNDTRSSAWRSTSARRSSRRSRIRPRASRSSAPRCSTSTSGGSAMGSCSGSIVRTWPEPCFSGSITPTTRCAAATRTVGVERRVSAGSSSGGFPLVTSGSGTRTPGSRRGSKVGATRRSAPGSASMTVTHRSSRATADLAATPRGLSAGGVRASRSPEGGEVVWGSGSTLRDAATPPAPSMI